MLRRWFLDPSDVTLDAQGSLLCWSLIALILWQVWWPMLLLIWLPLRLAFGF